MAHHLLITLEIEVYGENYITGLSNVIYAIPVSMNINFLECSFHLYYCSCLQVYDTKHSAYRGHK